MVVVVLAKCAANIFALQQFIVARSLSQTNLRSMSLIFVEHVWSHATMSVHCWWVENAPSFTTLKAGIHYFRLPRYIPFMGRKREGGFGRILHSLLTCDRPLPIVILSDAATRHFPVSSWISKGLFVQHRTPMASPEGRRAWSFE